jgi:ankyrin repeat protein
MASSPSFINTNTKKRSRDQSDSAESSEKRRRVGSEKQRQFIEILTQLKQSNKKTDEERDSLFIQLKILVQEGDVALTATIKPSGWNILHLAVFFGRIDVLICVQQALLPKSSDQYEKLLRAKTTNRQVTPISMAKEPYKAPHREEMSVLLNEKSLPLLREKQLAVILKILVSDEKTVQRAALYEQLKQLIIEGADLKVIEDSKGFTALHYAVDNYDIDLVRYVLQHSSLGQIETLLSTKTKNDLTPISIAEEFNYETIFLVLVRKKDLIQIFAGLKLLGTATEKDKQALYEKITQFIEQGGDPVSKDDRGLTFLHYAACFKDIGLVRLIKEHSTLEQYAILLHTKSRNLKKTPHETLRLQYEKQKGPANSEMLELLDPKAAQNMPPSSQQVGGAFSFFNNPTFLDEGPAPVRPKSFNK